MKKIIGLIVGIFAFSLVSGCAVPGYNYSQNAAMTQAGAAAAGAVAGQAIGRSTEGTLIGAGVGYILGGLLSPFTIPQYGETNSSSSGNCYWRQETEWGPDGRPRQVQRRVCEGNTPWQPGQ